MIAGRVPSERVVLEASERADGSWLAFARRGEKIVAVSGGFETVARAADPEMMGFSCPEAALLDVLARAAGAGGMRCDACVERRADARTDA